MKRLFKIARLGVVVLLAVLAMQFSGYLRVLTAPAASVQADALVVFAGSEDRLRMGYALADQGRARYLIISPADGARLARLAQKYPAQPGFTHLVEPAARTTFENAVLTAELIRSSDIRSILLVTSRFHMPRSYFLLRMVLAGTGIEILPCPVDVAPFDPWPPAWRSLHKKQVHNEMIEFWGSVLEMARYRVTGRLPGEDPQEKAAISFLRSVLLFRV